jgi:hypothetical protein
MSAKNSDLRAPLGIYILAALFLLAPLGNIFFSFAASGIDNWFYPAKFIELLGAIPVVDWLWLGGIFIAGISLLLRHKSAWMTAVLVLLLVLLMNTYRAFTLDETQMNTEFVRVQILVSILVTFSVLIIAFYARYPFLDRRQQWLAQTAHRYGTATRVSMSIGSAVVQGTTNSLSTNGAQILFEELPEKAKDLKPDSSLDLTFPEMDDLKIETEVVELSGKVLRVKFKNFTWAERSRLEAWLKSRKD